MTDNGSSPQRSNGERRLEVARQARDLMERSGTSAEALARWDQLLADPLLPAVLEDAADDARAWWVEGGRIRVAADSPRSGADPGAAADRSRAENRRSSMVADRERLPVPLSRFIGRERELATVMELLRKHPLVTITGASGVGKTRLVHELRKGLGSIHVALVDLAAIDDPRLVASEVAAALGRQEGTIGFYTASLQQREAPFAERLVASLRDRRLLLILDNCEQVVEACAGLVKALLHHCPQLRVLCTSRAALDLDEEHPYRLPPMTLPPWDRSLGSEDVQAFDAIHLYLDRARVRRPDLQPSAEDLTAISELCRRVDGTPYAIELAAARIETLSPQQVLTRLDDALGLLARPDAHRPVRQRSLRAMIEWSHALLPAAEQTLLRRLACFRGGFGVEAVEEVCAFGDLDGEEVGDLLDNLIAASLVEAGQALGIRRAHLLEPVRQFAAELAREAGEDREVRARHGKWHLRLAERAQSSFWRGVQDEWLDVLELERDNLRSALDHGAREGADERLRLAATFAPFWYVRGYLGEGRAHLSRALKDGMSADPDVRAEALVAAAEMAMAAGDLDDAHRDAASALPLARALGNRWIEAQSLHVLGMEAHRRGRFADARALILQSRRINADDGRHGALGFGDLRLGNIAETAGEYVAARRWYEEAERNQRRSGNTWGLGWALHALGCLDLYQNRFDSAEGRLWESHDIARGAGSRQLVVLALLGLGDADHRRADHPRAARRYAEAVEATQDLEDSTCVCMGHVGMADALLERGDVGLAAAWLGRTNVHDPLLRHPARARLLQGLARNSAARGDATGAELLHRRALRLWHQLRSHRHCLEQLEELALLSVRSGRREHGAGLLAVTAAARAETGLPMAPLARNQVLEVMGTLDLPRPAETSLAAALEHELRRLGGGPGQAGVSR